MTHEDKIKIARRNFLLAAEEFDFEFVSPFTLTDGIEVFGYITNYGSKNGTVIGLMTPPDVPFGYRISDWCKEMDCYCSYLNIDFLTGEYNRSYFRKMLRDWGRY